jgi:hypothetical protein
MDVVGFWKLLISRTAAILAQRMEGIEARNHFCFETSKHALNGPAGS